MENIQFEHRVVVKFLIKEGCNATAIRQRLVAVYSNSAPNYCTVTRWYMNLHMAISLWKMTSALVGLRM